MLRPSPSDVPWRFGLELEQRQMMMDERSLLTSMLMRASLPRDPDRVAGDLLHRFGVLAAVVAADPSELPVRRAKPARVAGPSPVPTLGQAPLGPVASPEW